MMLGKREADLGDYDAQEARSQFIQSFLTWSAFVCGYFIFQIYWFEFIGTTFLDFFL